MPLFFFLRKKERQKTIFFLFFAIAQPINCLGSNTLGRFYSHALPVARLLLNKKTVTQKNCFLYVTDSCLPKECEINPYKESYEYQRDDGAH